MKNKNAVLIVLVCFLLQPIRVSADGKPVWVPSGKHPGYNPKIYLVGIGIAPVSGDGAADIQKADNAARSDIAKQIQVSLHEVLSTTEESVSETGYDNTVSSKEQTKLKISLKNRESVKLTLEGVEIADRYFDSDAKLYYSLAVLNKAKTASRMSAQASEKSRESGRSLKDGTIALNSGGIVEGIRKLILATDLYENAQEDSKISSILGIESIKISPGENPNNALLDAVGKIDIQCISGCSQKARIGDALPEDVVVKAVFNNLNPIGRLPVIANLQSEKSDSSEIFYTSAEGTVSVKIPHIKKTGKKDNSIEIVPAWDAMVKDAIGSRASSWQGRLTSTGATVRYETRSEASTRVLISSCLDIDGRQADDTVAIQILAGQMRAAGFIVSTSKECIQANDIEKLSERFSAKADLVVIIDSDSKKSKKSSRIVYRVNMSITGYDMLRSEIVATMDSEAVGMANDSGDATDRALDNACNDAAKIFIQKVEDNLR